ncbi:hypothetical protein MAM1_0321c09649 [Mucor ambiguus]|uniref:Uncharacterized protein n=1 Tax=Mucor ambiguus TaxID=91626 RepID=A0A0C9N699_9FUNG|nr:hypothetical protein MAM1_0321c09649 [Mucor ambiguus]
MLLSQFRLEGNKGLLPDFTYQLLVNLLRLSNNTPHHALPLLFKSPRYKNTLNGLHPFSSMSNAMDICRQEGPINVAWQLKPSVTTILSLPLIEIFSVAPTNVEKLEFLQHESVKVSKAQDFLEYNHDQGQFQFKPQATYSRAILS